VSAVEQAVQPRRSHGGETKSGFANLSTESDVRETDGNSRGRRKLSAGAKGGETQPRGRRHGSNDHGAIGTASDSELVDTQRQTTEGDLRPESSEAGRDTEAKRRHADARHPNGAGSVHTATAVAGADTDLGAAIQRAQLWVSTGAQRTGRRASRTAVCAGREGLGGGSRHHEVLRPRQSRHTNGPDRANRPGQAGVGADREIPAAGSDGGGDSGSQRGRDAARRTVVAAAGEHLSGWAR